MSATANPNNFVYTARPRLPVVGEGVIASGWLLTIGLMLALALIQLGAAPGVLLGRLGVLGVGAISVIGHVVAAIMFFPDSPWVAIGLLLIDATVLLCLLSIGRNARLATG